MPEMSQTVELFGSAVRFVRYHEQWEDDDSKEYPDVRYMDLAEELIEAFKDQTIPKSCRRLQAAVELLEREYLRHEVRKVAKPDGNFGAAVYGIVEAVKPPGDFIPRIMEPMAELMALPGMIASQVATMYGLVDKTTGTPRSDLVNKEIATPGSVITEGWEHPDETTRREAHEDLVATFSELASWLDDVDAPKVAQPCPETPRQLFDDGVPIPQAAQMLLLTEQEVRGLYAEFSEGSGDEDEDKKPSKPETDADGLDLEQMTHRQLADLAKSVGIGVVSDKKGMLARLVAHLEQENAK